MDIELDAPLKGMTELTLLSTEARIVPPHVYEALKPYAEAYQQVYGKELLP